MAKDKRVVDDASYGIVPALAGRGGYQYLLIQHRKGHWGFPKGHAEAGETPLAAACREFEEETGIRQYQVDAETCFEECYEFTRKRGLVRKRVAYFPAVVSDAAVIVQESEVQAFAWLDYAAARARITFVESQLILDRARSHFEGREA